MAYGSCRSSITVRQTGVGDVEISFPVKIDSMGAADDPFGPAFDELPSRRIARRVIAGIRKGMDIRKVVWTLFVPSMAAASNRVESIPIRAV